MLKPTDFRRLAPWLAVAAGGFMLSAVFYLMIAVALVRSCRSSPPSPISPPSSTNATKIAPTSDREVRIAGDALRLLKAAVDGKDGRVVAAERLKGYEVRVGASYFCKSENGPREAARWRTAVQTLTQERLIESVGWRQSHYSDTLQYEYFRVTSRGYDLLDDDRK